MKRRSLVASALLAVVCGCQSQQPAQSINTNRPGPFGHAEAVLPISRSQKPDGPAVQQASLGTLLNAIPEQTAGDHRPVATILATVRGVPILEQEVRSVAPGASTEEVRHILDLLIDRELILQDAYTRFGKVNGGKVIEKMKEEAGKQFDRTVIQGTKKKLKMQTDEEFKDWLRNQGTSVEALRRQWERQFIQQQYLQIRISPLLDRVGREELTEYYDKHPEEFQVPDGVQWQDLFVAVDKYPSREAARQFAQQLLTRARQGEDFIKLVKQYDNGDSSYRDGAGVGEHRGEIKPHEAEELLFRMRNNDVELVELGNGFHVVRLVNRQQAGQTPFDEKTQAAIRDKLKNEIFARETKRIVAELRDKAKGTIEIAGQKP